MKKKKKKEKAQIADIQTCSSFLFCMVEEKKKKTKAAQVIDIQTYILFCFAWHKKIRKKLEMKIKNHKQVTISNMPYFYLFSTKIRM